MNDCGDASSLSRAASEPNARPDTASPTAAPLVSAVYEGRVRHHRHAPREHRFGYRIAQLYLDLDEIDRAFEHRWLWSRDRRNVAEFRRADYLGPHDMPLADAVRQRIAQATGDTRLGPIRLLTHLRYFGYAFNPVSFYYCYDADGRNLRHVLAEITNTPWRERHAYVLPVDQARTRGRAWHWRFDKTFHVSPFMAMERRYAWTFTEPGDELRVHMSVLRGDRREFDAHLALRRRPLTSAALARVLWRYPAMTAQIVAAIHWHALRLWIKRVPIHDHPIRLRSPHELDRRI